MKARSILKSVLQLTAIALLFFGLTKSYLVHRGKFHDDDDDDSPSTHRLKSQGHETSDQGLFVNPNQLKRAGIRASEMRNVNGQALNIPNSAVVWKDGQAFIYLFQKSDVLRFIPASYQEGKGWSAQIPPNGLVVVKGAGILLSQQYHTQVKAGDDD